MKNTFNKSFKKYQKTACYSGFIASVGSKPILIPQVKVNRLYHKMDYLSKVGLFSQKLSLKVNGVTV